MRLDNWDDFSKITETDPVLLIPVPAFPLLGPKTTTHQAMGETNLFLLLSLAFPGHVAGVEGLVMGEKRTLMLNSLDRSIFFWA